MGLGLLLLFSVILVNIMFLSFFCTDGVNSARVCWPPVLLPRFPFVEFRFGMNRTLRKVISELPVYCSVFYSVHCPQWCWFLPRLFLCRTRLRVIQQKFWFSLCFWESLECVGSLSAMFSAVVSRGSLTERCGRRAAPYVDIKSSLRWRKHNENET